LAGVEGTAQFLANEVSPNTAFNLMDQYYPEYNVRCYPNQFPKLKRRISPEEYQSAVCAAQAAGLNLLRDG